MRMRASPAQPTHPLRAYIRGAVDRVLDRLPFERVSAGLAGVAARFGYEPRGYRPDSARSWESAQTTRVNSSHWEHADDESVNLWLLAHLKTLRTRCVYEARNNPVVASAIRTWATGVLGQEGPRLQVQSSSGAFERKAEELWQEVWEQPEITGKMSGAELLRLLVGYEPTRGEYLAQYVTDPSAQGVQSRLYAIDPRRLESPLSSTQIVRDRNSNHIILGVERNGYGKPLRYSFRDDYEAVGYSFHYVWRNADEIVHEYQVQEAGQARGIPWLADCLDDAGQLRDFDQATLAAARVAAEHGVVLTTTHPDAVFSVVDSEVEIEPSTISTMPPHYTPTHIKPEHPATGYAEFRHERQRPIGLAFGMPLMMLLLDSAQHNYSSARFDGQLFARACAAKRRNLERRLLAPFARRIFVEGRLGGRLQGFGPRDYRLVWRWEPIPHVDPTKEAEAAQARITAGMTSLTHECAAIGLDYVDEVLPTLAREREARAALGLPDPGAAAMEPAKEDEAEDGKQQDQRAHGAALRLLDPVARALVG